MPEDPPSPKREVMPDYAAAALSYALGAVTGALFLILEPYNRNRLVYFHAWQSIYYSAAGFLLYFLCVAAVMVMPWSVIGIVWFLMFFGTLALVGMWFWLMYQAYQGKRWKAPLIGPLAQQRVEQRSFRDNAGY